MEKRHPLGPMPQPPFRGPPSWYDRRNKATDTSQGCSGKRPEQPSAKGLKQARLPAMCLNVDFSSMLSLSLRLLAYSPQKTPSCNVVKEEAGALSLPMWPFTVNTEGF